MFQGVHHIAVIVSDLEKAKDFYVKKLGFPILQETFRPEKGDCKLDLQAGAGVCLEIFAVPNPPARVTNPEAAGLRHLAFRTDDILRDVAELERRGIPCEPIRTDPVGGGRYTFFRDPDGLPLELHE